MAANSWSYLQYINNWRCGIWKNEFSFKSNKAPPDIDKSYLYAKDPYEAIYQLFINKRENAGLKNFNNFKDFIDYSNDVDDIYKNIGEYNPNEKRKILIVFDDVIATMLSNPIVTELFFRGRKFDISLVFITLLFYLNLLYQKPLD